MLFCSSLLFIPSSLLTLFFLSCRLNCLSMRTFLSPFSVAPPPLSLNSDHLHSYSSLAPLPRHILKTPCSPPIKHIFFFLCPNSWLLKHLIGFGVYSLTLYLRNLLWQKLFLEFYHDSFSLLFIIIIIISYCLLLVGFHLL